LEYALGVAGAYKLIGFFIVGRDVRYVDFYPARPLYHLDRLLDYGKGF
jgi:hypothetical protein